MQKEERGSLGLNLRAFGLFIIVVKVLYFSCCKGLNKIISYLAGMSPYISLKIKKRHYEHHMIEAHKYLITWISDDISFENSG